MEIQKEKEAFETWWESFHNGRQISCDYVEKDNSYSVGYANAQWVAWQAKAQAVPEGFVLVPKKPSEITISAMKRSRRQFSTYAAESMYEAIIEAQEQGHD